MINNILFAGLPESGKTTFIAALWYYLFNIGEESQFTYGDLEDSELEYLNSLSLSWASCKEVMRTSQNRIENVDIPIKKRDDDSSINLRIPDISGETFRSQFSSREWDEDFDNLLNSVSGILMFVDPRDVKNMPRLIFHENQHYKIFGENLINEQNETVWNEDSVPSQVKLVDFLQMIDYHKSFSTIKISIIVSCWDLVGESISPEIWCKNNVSLLYQYLISNGVIFEAKFFGVSSQGSAYDPPALRTDLLSKEPLERIMVTDGVEISNNILNPIIWIANENKN